MELVTDRETLVAALREYGVDYLTPTDAELNRPIDSKTLIGSLAAHSDPRLRQSLIALFLLQPQLGPLVVRLRNDLPPQAAQELATFYTAAMYLQRMWRLRLSYYLDRFDELKDYFSSELELPAADDEHGKAGLCALAEWHANRSPYHFNYLSAYEGVAELLFQSLKLKRRHELAPAG